MPITENIQTQLDKGKYCAGAFVDLKKAFDTVDHNMLLQKLDNEWSCSYLKKRKVCQYRKEYVICQRNLNRSSTGINSWPTLLPHLYK